MTTIISGISSWYWRGEERVENEHQPIEKLLYSLALRRAVADPTLPRGTGVTPAFRAPGARATYTSNAALLRTFLAKNTEALNLGMVNVEVLPLPVVYVEGEKVACK